MPWDGPLDRIAPAVHEIPATYTGERGDLAMRVPGRVVADNALLTHIKDDVALEQVAHVACLPGIVGASWAMPDIHQGYGFPIGGVAAFAEDGIVSPGGVGFDINCGVRLLATDLQAEDVQSDMPRLMDALFSAVPAGMGGKGRTGIQDLDAVLTEGARWAVEEGLLPAGDLGRIEGGGRIDEAQPEHVSERALLRGTRSLGSLGSGNHFCEVQAVDQVLDDDAARAFGIRDGTVVLMVHTGSRGLGHQVCQDHVGALQGLDHGIALPDRQLACAPLGSKEADTYLGAMGAAANFAFANRSIVCDRAADALQSVFPGATTRVVYDVCHNIAKWERHEGQNVLVHRKGATRAFGPGHPELPAGLSDVGQPVIVPGDMGRASWILAGGQDPSKPGPFASSCHGAGRRLSRTAAKRRFDGQDLIQHLAAQGIHVRATSSQVAAEEAPEAYKDVSQVVAAAEMAGLATRVARMRPLGVVKG